MLRERWVDHRGVRLQVLESGDAAPGCVPVLLLPGTPAPAQEYAAVAAALAPHPSLAVSLRGCGPSDAPDTGYALEDFVSDVEAVIDSYRFEQVCLVGFSIATAYVLAYALRHPTTAHGLVLVDYPPRYPAFPPEFADRVLANSPPDLFPPKVIRGIQADSRSTDFAEELPQVRCPVLVVRAGRGSRLTDAHLQTYQSKLPAARVATLPDAPHDARQPTIEPLVGTIREFLAGLEFERARHRGRKY